MKKQLVVLTLLSSLPFTASSQLYFGGKAGVSSLKNSCAVGSPCEDDSNGFGGFVGYQLIDNVALEFGYDKYGDFKSNYNNGGTIDTLEGDLTAYSIAPKFNVGLSESIDFFSKIGAAYSYYDTANDDLNLLAALGLEGKLTDAIRARLEYQVMAELNSGPAKDTSASMFSVGLSYHFGTKKPEPVAKVEPRPAPEPKPEPAPVVEEKKPEPPKKQTITFQSQQDVSLFETGSSKLSAAGTRRFESVATLLTTYPQSKVDVVGHTDSRGSAKFNQKLSEQRAQAVADYLIAKGVDPSRITVKGEGEANPVASNDTAAGREQNRRVEVTIEEFTVEE
ncbi:putative outer membrane protein A [Vibrio nigripulchritudo SOn1]|uniref:Outer membrane protein A n=1 Tax=Vibrio nigripulchritudo SOn1 TaxID=1238450 RepID=A0AAV2VNT5_9VIBR|nr:OmpA family protein [Vibrio nigripulchritudo]CCO46047.1 putative outer membrane protein A [Vibrio nigripulchritudo SOn1]